MSGNLDGMQLKMVYLLNDGLSGGNPKKGALDNGYHCSSLGDAPKYKPRKISAVRDFPQGCGQDVKQIILAPGQNVTVAIGEQSEVQSFKLMKSPVRMESNGNMVVPHFDSLCVSIEGNGGIEGVTQLCTPTKTNEFRMPADVEHQEIVGVPVGNGMVSGEKADCPETSAEPEIKNDEVLGNPVMMHADVLLDDLVEKVVAVVMDGMDNQVEEELLDVKPIAIELPKDLERKSFKLPKEGNGKEAQALVKQLHNLDSLSLVDYVPEEDVKPLSETGLRVDREVLQKDKAVPSPKDKFRRRRVSATRDFPPCCGRNSPLLAEEEHLRVASGDKSLTGIEKGGDIVVAGGGETKGNIGDGCVRGSGGGMSLTNRISSGVKLYGKEVSVMKEIVVCEPVGAVMTRASNDFFTSGHSVEPVLVNALNAAPYCPWRQGRVASSSEAVKSGSRANKRKAAWLKKAKAVAKKTTIKSDSSNRPSLKRDSVSVHEDADGSPSLPAVKDGEEYGEHSGSPQDLPSGRTPDFQVTVPPYGPNSSCGDARNKVRETLRLFQTICRKLLQGDEAKTRSEGKRIDLEAVKIMKNKGKDVAGKKYMGAVPGVEVGDEFQYRVELAIVGIHRLYQAGIDYMKQNGKLVAISIVSSGAYADDKEDADSLLYCGQGGNLVGKDKEPEDQKLERGNLALKNSIMTKNPVRVIHGFKESKISDLADSKSKIVTTYVYDGLYTVETLWQEKGKHGKLVYMFKLKKIPGQPELPWKEVKKSNKSKVRHGVCVTDIAEGKELIPICAVNTINNEKPPAFCYITKIMYADWSHLLPPQGCDCSGRCSDSARCSCARKNGGEIPYNRNGAIVEAKPIVYECGPSCKCPPSCYNRVSQHGIRLPLEIFKTETRGWGVRSLISIPSGTFICEYVGELLEDKEAEKRKNDEYLFDIGQKYSDSSIKPDGEGISNEPIEEVGYTIDAAYYGNVGRFINHSCSPNLYAQDVLYDHGDKRMPHIMLFAAENIPALKELTYHYNYSLDQVHDSNGNIKTKSCYCGSTDCIGRLY